jgi:hypothetical protein
MKRLEDGVVEPAGAHRQIKTGQEYGQKGRKDLPLALHQSSVISHQPAKAHVAKAGLPRRSLTEFTQAKAGRQQSPAVSYQQDANSTLMTVGAFGQKAN